MKPKQESKKERKPAWRAVLAIVGLALCIGLPLTLNALAAGESYATPDYWIDFSKDGTQSDCVEQCRVSVVHNEEGYASVQFEDTGNGESSDPYMSFVLPANNIDCNQYSYLAMLVRTNLHTKKGEWRFRTGSTGNEYPAQSFSYADTEDWQLIVVQLTDPQTVMYVSKREFSGNYNNIRLDMFDNSCSTDTVYDLRALAFYKTRKEAETLPAYVEAQTALAEKELADLLAKNSAYPKGAAFTVPAMNTRMRYVMSGFDQNWKQTVDNLLSRGYGGVVNSVPFNQSYLKDEASFAELREAYAYAREQGMSTWIYDEYQWPSGKAFGQVLEGHDDYEAVGIQHRVITGNGGTASYTVENSYDISLYAAVLTDNSGVSMPDCKGKSTVSVTADGAWTLDVYVLRHSYEGVEDRSDFTKLRDVDLLNPDAVARFITLTYEKYKQEFGTDFGYIDAFFTDEPQLGNRGKADYIVWTDGFAEDFFTAYGYDLDITLLFAGDSLAAKRERIHYYSLVAAKFKAAYTDQLTAFCTANNIESSGHFLFEENMNDHIETYGGDFLQIVGGMTIPGSDVLLTDPTHLLEKSSYIGTFAGLRYVASAARNAGKTRIMVEYNPAASETQEFKNDLMGTSIGGLSLIRLFGATDFNVINPQNSYTAAQNKTLNTYVGRMNTILEGAHESGDLAVFYPIASVQALHNADDVHSSEGGKTSPATELNADYTVFCKVLLQQKVLYSVIDDQSICASVVTKDGRMVIGDGSYRVLILAYADYLSGEAARKLETFVRAGGKVFFVGGVPQYGLLEQDDATVSEVMNSLCTADNLFEKGNTKTAREIAQYATVSVSIDTCKGVSQNDLYSGEFENDTQDIVFLVNSNKKNAVLTLSYTDGYSGEFLVYFPGSGEIMSCTGSASLTLPAYEGVFLVREDDNTRDDTPYADETVTPDGGNREEEPTADAGNVTADTDKEQSKGCGSAVGSLCALLTTALGAVCCRRRKE